MSGDGAPDTDADSADEAGPAAEIEDVDEDAAIEALRSAVNRARASARARGFTPGMRPRRSDVPAERRRRMDPDLRSGPRADARDPQPMSSVMDRIVAERGWRDDVAVGGVMGRWDAVVGAEIAAHCRPETFTEGVLIVRTDSTAWATQVKLLLPTLVRRLSEEVGEGVVLEIRVQGPQAPSWRKGPRSAHGGQGPRDTYG